MMTLDEAWKWYEKTQRQLTVLRRIGWKHWDSLPWDAELGRDDQLKTIDAGDIVRDTVFCLDHLNDFAVLILFSAFESAIRERAQSDVRRARDHLEHPLVTRILDESIRDIEQGSLFRVLDVYKSQDADLIEEVNQVRRYRNWVAHGRRGQPPFFVGFDTAYDRLKRFLDRFTEPIPDEG